MEAVGVGFVDLLLTRGEYQIRPDPPFIPGIEVAGTLRATGERVCATTLFGGFAGPSPPRPSSPSRSPTR